MGNSGTFKHSVALCKMGMGPMDKGQGPVGDMGSPKPWVAICKKYMGPMDEGRGLVCNMGLLCRGAYASAF